MKITICTSGRFHVADLARELLRQGHNVQLNSYVPPAQLEQFGIPTAMQHCHLAKIAPLVFAHKKLRLPRRVSESIDNLVIRSLDNTFARINSPGDVFIGMSGLCLKSLRSAKARGAHVVLERGSTHILEQKEILDGITRRSTGSSMISSNTVNRELAGYELADTISIPSRHVELSFLERGISASKLFRNPYGVDLKIFHKHGSNIDQNSKSYNTRFPVDVITTGTWCLRKGSDMLANVVLNDLGLSLLHVGSVGDFPLPRHPRFQHHPPVSQSELPRFYRQANVFAMPSREDGFGMVFSQALACGLPVVGSTNSGVPDLAEHLGLSPPRVYAVPPDSPTELANALLKALHWARATPHGSRIQPDFSALSWEAYGERYSCYLKVLLDRA